MINTSARLLRLLSLLQVQREWTGAQLAERLSVSARTIRADVERLRSLGYPVDSTPGVAGGYRLGAGAALPPLLLDDDEALAVAVGLRVAVGGMAGIEESSLRALAKLEQVLPPRLRQRLATLLTATVALPTHEPAVDPEVLTTVSAAIRFREQLRFDYRSLDGAVSRRTVEPHRLVYTRGRWYLAAWDGERDDWRIFRADRIGVRVPNGPRFPPRAAPEGDLVGFVERSLGRATWQCRARAVVAAPAAVITARVPAAVVVEEVDATTCVAHVGSDTPEQLALWLGLLDADFTVDGPPELVSQLQVISGRYARAAEGGHHSA